MTFVLFVRLPAVAVIVNVYVFLGVFRDVVTVNVEVPALVPVIETGFGWNVAVPFGGMPLAARLTVPAKPPAGVIVMVYDAAPPLAAVADDGDADTEKLGATGLLTVCTSGAELLTLNVESPP